MKIQKILVLKGLPASGKSTYARKLIDENPGKYKRVNKDDLRAMLDNSKWSKENEKFVLKIRDIIIWDALKSGKSVIVDDTNLHQKHTETFSSMVLDINDGYALNNKDYYVELEEKFFDTPVEECIRRDAERKNSVGREVIERMYAQFLKPEPAKYEPPEGKPRAYIFDIDGTLAKMKDRGPFDWKRVGEDQLNFHVYLMLRRVQEAGEKIIIFTGRDGCCEAETKKWLKENAIDYDHFDIRPEGNTEKDSVVKKRMFDKIKNDYIIMGVFDDRDQVVKMWRELGLTCFQVAEGNF